MSDFANNAILNKPGFNSIAAISYDFELDGYGGIESDISISDCSRAIHLDFSIYAKHTKDKFIDVDKTLLKFDNNIHKAQTLISMVQEFLLQYENKREEYKQQLIELNNKRESGDESI